MAFHSACSFQAGAGAHDGATVDAHADGPPIVGSDAGSGSSGSDAGPGSGSARAAADLVLGAGRTSVGTITVDIQLGAGPQPTHLTAGTIQIEGAPVVAP